MSSGLSVFTQSVTVTQLTHSYLLCCSNLLVKISLEIQDQPRFGIKAPLTRVSTWTRMARGVSLVTVKELGIDTLLLLHG